MIPAITVVPFCLLVPVLLIWLGERHTIVDKIGAAIISYAVGIVAGNVGRLLGLIPETASGLLDTFSSVAVAIALPLIYFSLDMRTWRRAGPKALLSFAIEIVAVLIASSAGYLVFRGAIGPESNKIAGMLVGVYTGGTINLVAIGKALGVSAPLFVAANTADMAGSGIYMLFIMLVGQRVLNLVLPRSKPVAAGPEQTDSDRVAADGRSYTGIFRRRVLLPLLAAFALAVMIAGAGLVLTFVLPGQWGTITAILAITTLGIGASFIPRVRCIPMTHQLGQYFVLVFCMAIGMMSDVVALVTAVPAVLGFVGIAIFGSLLLHVAGSAIFRIDTDTVIITSVAGIYSPPFIPMVCSALKNRDVLVPGIITGIIGWVLGTYLGIGLSFVLPRIFG
jgi:uncharacterized membrane protein